jgi:hypothetical protein
MVRERFEKIPEKVPHFKEVMKLLRFLEDLGKFLTLKKKSLYLANRFLWFTNM